MKILILKPSSLGDVVQALPVLRLLRLHFPSSEIFWWIDASLAPLLEGDPDLTGVVRFERQRWRSPVHWAEAVASFRHLREHRFDWVIDLQSLFRSGLVAWLANGGFTIGLDDPREGARGFYDAAVPRPSYDTHAVDWYLQVLRKLEVPVHDRFTWLPKPKNLSASFSGSSGDSRWIALQPGARWSNKRWPAENFAAFVKEISLSRPDVQFAIIGSKTDRDLGRIVSQGAPERCLDLTGRTELPEMVDWIRKSELLVTNDTGPMHIAAALGTRVVALFGPTEPKRTGPYGQLDNVLREELSCSPCLKSVCSFPRPMECLHLITVDRVVHRAMKMLQDSTTS